MRKFYLSLFILSFTLSAALAQSGEFDTHIQNLQSGLSTVASGSKTYDQEIKKLEFGGLLYTVVETDSKGSKTTYGYEFNLSDIDPYAMREVTQKDVILVSMTVRNKQKLVKVYKNGTALNYTDQVEVRAKDIENARSMTDIIKKAIPAAEKLIAGKLKLAGYDAMINWLTSNNKTIELGDKTIKQTITKDARVGSLTLKQLETDAKGSREESYTFNLADVNLNSLSFKVAGNKFALTIEMTQKLKSVTFLKEGKRSYANEIAIVTNNVDEARDFKNVITMATPLAIDKVKADNPKIASSADAVNAIKGYVKDIKNNDGKEQKQSIDGQCAATYTYTMQTANATDKHVYTFNLMDINPNLTKIAVTGDKMYLEAPAIDKKQVIMHAKNDKLDGYDRDINIYVEDMEQARRLKYAVDQAAEKCKASYKDPFGAAAKDAFNWLKNNVGEVVVEETSVKQTLDASDASNFNKLKFTTIAVKSNTSTEQIFEFNLADINPATIEIVAKGKWLYVTFETNFKNKIINAYKDGRIQPYTNTIEIAAKDVETARAMVSAFKKCVENFKSK